MRQYATIAVFILVVLLSSGCGGNSKASTQSSSLPSATNSNKATNNESMLGATNSTNKLEESEKLRETSGQPLQSQLSSSEKNANAQAITQPTAGSPAASPTQNSSIHSPTPIQTNEGAQSGASVNQSRPQGIITKSDNAVSSKEKEAIIKELEKELDDMFRNLSKKTKLDNTDLEF